MHLCYKSFNLLITLLSNVCTLWVKLYFLVFLSRHEGKVTNVIEGTSLISVTLDDGKVKTLELGKQGVRFVPQKQKRSKTWRQVVIVRRLSSMLKMKRQILHSPKAPRSSEFYSLVACSTADISLKDCWLSYSFSQ